jgi:DNA modification methylase
MTPYYEEDGIAIYHGDCREVLPRIAPPRTGSGSFDLLLTDPPYGIGADRGQAARANQQHGHALVASRDYGVTTWDDTTADEAVAIARACCRWQIIFGGNFYDLPPARCLLVWDKENGTNDYADCEIAWTNLKKPVRRLAYRWHGMLQEPGVPRTIRVHPTQKPEAVMRWALMQAPPEAQTILDPFMGSGTTLVAAKRLGRKAIGIEIEEKYCEIAAERLRQGALDLFGEAVAQR